MTPLSPLRRVICGLELGARCPRIWCRRQCMRPLATHIRRLHQQQSLKAATANDRAGSQHLKEWKDYENLFNFRRASQTEDFIVGNEVTVHGYLKGRRVQHARLMFVDVVVPDGPSIQAISTWQDERSEKHNAHEAVAQVPLLSPVALTGKIVKIQTGRDPSLQRSRSFPDGVSRIDLELVNVQELNQFPKDIIVSKGVQFPPSARHLQIRFSQSLQNRLHFRDYINQRARQELRGLGFREYETPVLFKSTPEGAREFVVPTRRPGFAFALPQSPQQFKQLLMASGLGSYYQFARCFRDEDLRADRQPEFTQLDLEMPFATGEDVMKTVEQVVRRIYRAIRQDWVLGSEGSDMFPLLRASETSVLRRLDSCQDFPDIDVDFRHIAYEEAMSKYGSDKPDLRIPNTIHRIDQLLPNDFKGKISSLETPVVEACRFRLNGHPKELQRFVSKVMNTLPLAPKRNPDGEPVMLLHQSGQPLNGFASLGHEGFAALMSEVPEFSDLQNGDVLVIQARKDEPFQGGGTALGAIRSKIYDAATEAGLLPGDRTFRFAWVTNFPLFTPSSEDGDGEPGQGGTAGFSSTHHPFTAPLTAEDFALLQTDPLKAKADHYDLVVNGIELGGGSRRIHVAAVQEYVMRDILQMSEEGISQFSHLLEALRAGCPPHAGFALGFDRLVAVLSGTTSVRDVIAFPKSKKGEDLMVKSPAPLTEDQLQTYSLALRKL